MTPFARPRMPSVPKYLRVIANRFREGASALNLRSSIAKKPFRLLTKYDGA
jgi:hypothetical protein